MIEKQYGATLCRHGINRAACYACTGIDRLRTNTTTMTDDKVTKEDIELAKQDVRDREEDEDEAHLNFLAKRYDLRVAKTNLKQLQEEYDRQHD